MSGGIDPGRVRVRLTLAGDRVAGVEVASERPQVAAVLRGRDAEEAVRLVPLLFALCGKAQGCAASLALSAARGDAVAPYLDPAIQAEAMREHLWRWLLDLPALLGAAPMKAEFALAVSWIAAGERKRMLSLLGDSRIGALATRLDEAKDFAASSVALLPVMGASSTAGLWPRLDAGFCRQPQWQGAPAETGAYARIGGSGGGGSAGRWLARLAELRDWAQGNAKVGAGGTASSVSLAPGVGRALVETARGLLMHEIALDGERIADYRSVAPTEWNFHPQGTLPAWLAGSDARDRNALRARVMRAVMALDPCVRWELEVL